MPSIPTILTRPQQKPAGLLRQIGLLGRDRIEMIILAAIATQTPPQLIGPHGTAKSQPLCRLCAALRLSWRHYFIPTGLQTVGFFGQNYASLVNYNDLVGYPLPDAHGNLSFVQTPASVWDAQAIFINDLSRARVGMKTLQIAKLNDWGRR